MRETCVVVTAYVKVKEIGYRKPFSDGAGEEGRWYGMAGDAIVAKFELILAW